VGVGGSGSVELDHLLWFFLLREIVAVFDSVEKVHALDGEVAPADQPLISLKTAGMSSSWFFGESFPVGDSGC
jgi:hypothetical protein